MWWGVCLLWLVSCAPATPAIPTPTPTVAAATATLSPTATQPPTAVEVIESLVAARLAALKARDIEQYLTLIDASDPEYYTEQRNWFLAYQDAVTAQFTLEIINARYVDDQTIVATLYQHYLYGREKSHRTVTYEERFIHTAKGWKAADLNYAVLETLHFVIKYQAGLEAKAEQVGIEAEKAYASVVERLGLTPQARVTLKLFDTRELLRENSDIRVVYLFSGWAEDGESIKMYGRRMSSHFAPVVAHELTHKITLGISDSMPSWFAEGLADYYGAQPFRNGNALQQRAFTRTELERPITWLEETNLTQIEDEVPLYYAISAMAVEFMAETYGPEQIHALLHELGRYPRHGRGHDYAGMEVENQKRFYEALQTVSGVEAGAFNQAWLKWIAVQSP